jgi:hypothetical protein
MNNQVTVISGVDILMMIVVVVIEMINLFGNAV